jgi:hypothetical protein
MNMHPMGNFCARQASGLKRFGLGASALLLLSASSCTVNTGSDVVPAGGRLILDWTIQDSTDPNLCVLSGATAIDINITTTSGQFVGGYQAACSTFATTISNLPAGSYAANAALVGPSGEARTTGVDTDAFVITSTDISIPINFPANSFF